MQSRFVRSCTFQLCQHASCRSGAEPRAGLGARRQNAGKSGLDQWNFTLLPTSSSQARQPCLMHCIPGILLVMCWATRCLCAVTLNVTHASHQQVNSVHENVGASRMRFPTCTPTLPLHAVGVANWLASVLEGVFIRPGWLEHSAPGAEAGAAAACWAHASRGCTRLPDDVQPLLQDPDGSYIVRWVPELARLPKKWVHSPWAAPAEVLEAAGVVLGGTYPLCLTTRDLKVRAL